jgi:polar amino acid transport system substrate-binding protein
MLVICLGVLAASPLRVCTTLDTGFNELKSDRSAVGCMKSDGNVSWKDSLDLTGYDAAMRENLLGVTMGLEYEVLLKHTYHDALKAVAARECDLAWAPFTTTSAREGCHANCTSCSCVDFSHTYIATSIGFMYRRNAVAKRTTPLEALLSPMIGNTISLFVIMIVVSAHIIWYCESRGNNPQFPVAYREGVAEGVWWTVVTAVRYIRFVFG